MKQHDHIFLFLIYLEPNAPFIKVNLLNSFVGVKLHIPMLVCHFRVWCVKELLHPTLSIWHTCAEKLYEPGRRCVDAKRERLMGRLGWVEPRHRWRLEADVPAELLGEVPANFETVTEVHWARGLPLNGWWDLGKQMLKNVYDSTEMSSLVVRQRGLSAKFWNWR